MLEGRLLVIFNGEGGVPVNEKTGKSVDISKLVGSVDVSDIGLGNVLVILIESGKDLLRLISVGSVLLNANMGNEESIRLLKDVYRIS